MNETRILLQAYYEVLYERLEASKPLLTARIDELLAEEVRAQGYEGFDDEMLGNELASPLRPLRIC